MKVKNISKKSQNQKVKPTGKFSDSSLIEVKPGSYMMLFNNKMKRIVKRTQGLELGTRVKDDNHKIVLVEEDVILVPHSV